MARGPNGPDPLDPDPYGDRVFGWSLFIAAVVCLAVALWLIAGGL